MKRRNPWAARTDANQARIVSALRRAGATVKCAHRVGGGFPDLVVGYRGTNILIEIKTVAGRLSPKQKKWHSTWSGKVFTVKTIVGAMRILAVIDAKLDGNGRTGVAGSA